MDKIKSCDDSKSEKTNSLQWEVGKQGTFFPCGGTVEKLLPGVYTPMSSMQGPYLKRKDVITDKLLRFEDPTHATIISEIDEFWNIKEKYNKLGFLHNRALLMHGPPGSGKTCISKIVSFDMVSRGGIVINCDNLYNLIPSLNAFRDVESDRQCLVLMEDIDEISGQSKLLPLLDGEETVDNVLYLLTTNYIHKLPERILRPGRIDRKISVPCPPEAGRIAFLQDKLGQDSIVPDLARMTDGMSFAHLRELLIGIYCLNQKVEDVILRLRNKGAEVISMEKEIKMDKAIARAIGPKDTSEIITASFMDRIASK